MQGGSPDPIVLVLLVLSTALLLAALQPVKRLVTILHRGRTRNTWIALASVMAISALGDLVFLGVHITEGPNHHEDALIALLCAFAAIFMFIACHLALRTAGDVARIASLELAASIDPLTNLYNRRQILSLLDDQCRLSIRDRSPLSVLLLDIDHFKAFNDACGHQAGDLVLREISGVLARALPDSRALGRIGGEEFLVLLPNTSSGDAALVAERLRASVENTEIHETGEAVRRLTISVGVATAYGWQETSEDLIAIADNALYGAKALGRNRVCHSFELPPKRTAERLSIVPPLPAVIDPALNRKA